MQTSSLLGAALGAVGMVTRNLPLGRGLDPQVVRPVGWHTHAEAVARLQASFAAIPSDKRVRLAKKTSNLFRGRATSQVPGLDVEKLNKVIALDPIAGTADVQGMCTYEDFVDTVLPFGFAPTVVPELKTITLGGAVTGMGVESSSFRSGLPHEAIIEMDVLIGTGEIITCSPTRNVDLYRGFPNSYGSLGYAVRLKVHLDRVKPYVTLRHLRFDDFTSLTESLVTISEERSFHNLAVDYLDGVVFSPQESYLILGTLSDTIPGPTSDYSREQSYYRSLQHPSGISHDQLTIRDYLWRWDPDWFWCSRAFGTQNPLIRSLWPRDLLRSSFYWKLIGLDRKYHIADRIEARAGRPARERVVQDIEVTPEHLPEFLQWFFDSCDIEPVWLCPIRLHDSSAEVLGRGEILANQDEHPWPLYPLKVDTTWVNVGFWSSVPVNLLGAHTGPGAFNRAIERKVSLLGGHKSLYSETFYSREEFEKLYGGSAPHALKQIYDPQGRFPGLFEKTVKGA